MVDEYADALSALEAAERDNTAPIDDQGPFIDLSAGGIDALLDTPPPDRVWLVEGLLACGIVALLAAAGGVGKSFFCLLLAMCVATGRAFFGMPIGAVGPVVIFSGEDDRDEIHRRLAAVVATWMEDDSDPEAIARWMALLRRNLIILDRVGADNRLTAKSDRVLHRTPLAGMIADAARSIGALMVILDPLSRFDGGDHNDNADGTRLIEAAEYIRKTSGGATVLLPAHVSKASQRDTDAGQEAVRGASGLVDGARWVGLLSTMKPKEAKTYGVDPDHAGLFVRFTTPKANYSAPWPGMWLRRVKGGALAPSGLQEIDSRSQRQRAEDEHRTLLERIATLIHGQGPMPKRRIEDDYGGVGGVLAAGHKKVRTAIERGLQDGALVRRIEAGKEVVALPEVTKRPARGEK